METLGFVTLKEADSLLEFNIQYDYWNDSTAYTLATGTWVTSGLSANLIGTGTLATTELSLTDDIELDYNTAQVSVITDNTHITLDTAIDVSTDTVMKILTPAQRTTLEALWLKKKKSLISAYQLILSYCNIPTTPPDDMKNAQIYLAANLFYTNGASTSMSGQAANIKSYSIGDMSYTFNSSQSFSGNTPKELFPSPVYELLKPWLKNNKVFGVITSSAR